MSNSKPLINALYTYFLNRGMYDYKRGWLKGTCPYCGRADKFGVNLYLNRTNCFICGNHGRPIGVVGQIENITSYQEILSLLRSDNVLEYQEPLLELLEERPVNMPEGFVLLNEDRGIMADMMRNYVRNRGFDVNYLSSKGFGYCTTGKLFGYLIMPFYMNGKLIYYHTRNVLGRGPRFDNPPIEEFGVGKSSVIYNIDALWMYSTVYLAESVLNAETIGDKGIATGGKSISHAQLSIIKKSPVEKVIIMLDPDATDQIIEVAFSLIESKEVKVCIFPTGKDVNDLGRHRAMLYAYKARFLDHSSLIKLKNQLEYEKRSICTY